MTDIKINLKASYTFTGHVDVIFDDETKASINTIRRGSNYSPLGDSQLHSEYIEPLLDQFSDAFAAKAKKKGFERVSTGLTAFFKSFIYDEDSDYPNRVKGCVVKLEMERSR